MPAGEQGIAEGRTPAGRLLAEFSILQCLVRLPGKHQFPMNSYVFLAILHSASWSLAPQSGSASTDRGRDPAIDPARPGVVPDPRSGSIDPGTWIAPSTREPGYYVREALPPIARLAVGSLAGGPGVPGLLCYVQHQAEARWRLNAWILRLQAAK